MRKEKTEIPTPITVASSSITEWTTTSSNLSENFLSVDFATTKESYISGLGGVVYKTIDGGASYRSINIPLSYDCYSVDFTSETTGFVTATSFYYR